MKCITCRDVGIIGGCPSCGKTAQFSTESRTVSDDVLDAVAIPDYYKGNIWSRDTLIKTHPDVTAKTKLEHYATTLTRIHDIFSSGSIPNKSFMVMASPGMGKLTWAYSCMQEALKHGHIVVPIIDNTQFKRLSIISSDRMNSKFLKTLNYTIEDYLNADVMFMTVDPDNFQSAYRTISSLLNKRARAGKSTFILSRYSLEQISLVDYTQQFTKDIQAKPQQDRNKYLVVIGGI